MHRHRLAPSGDADLHVTGKHVARYLWSTIQTRQVVRPTNQV